MISPLDPGLRLIKIPIIAQDVGRAHDRSTAMIGVPYWSTMSAARSCSNSCSPSSATSTSVCPIARKRGAPYAQLTALEPEQRETGSLYNCPSGQHDDLGMSLAMLAWAGQHVHLDARQRPIFDAHRPRRQRKEIGWGPFVVG
jgi:hypothetical protein